MIDIHTLFELAEIYETNETKSIFTEKLDSLKISKESQRHIQYLINMYLDGLLSFEKANGTLNLFATYKKIAILNGYIEEDSDFEDIDDYIKSVKVYFDCFCYLINQGYLDD